ncbi:MAG: DUF1918 domain-containing protein [Halolamina sp.]
MSFDEDDIVVLEDKHSDFDGEVGKITQKVETMFDDANYTISFDDGQEVGVAAENLSEADVDEVPSGDDADE